MTQTFDQQLSQFESELQKGALEYEAVMEQLRQLKLPSQISSEQLERVYRICYSLMDFDVDGVTKVDLASRNEEWQAAHLVDCAHDLVEDTIFDRNARARAWIAEMRKWKEEEEEVDEGVALELSEADSDLPDVIEIPWNEDKARQEIEPYLNRFETALASRPTAHFKILWDVHRNGYPVFRAVFQKWLREIEGRGAGFKGTGRAMAVADDLYNRGDDDRFVAWSTFKFRYAPLLDDPHPMIAAGAMQYMGLHFAHAPFEGDDAPSLPETVERLRKQQKHRAAMAGALINGLDEGEPPGLSALTAHPAMASHTFDLDQWVLDILQVEGEELYLPNVQSFWFYVHEHYCSDSAFIKRLIAIDRPWVAMMCATERDEAVDGMRAVLDELAAHPNGEISGPSQAHLATYY